MVDATSSNEGYVSAFNPSSLEIPNWNKHAYAARECEGSASRVSCFHHQRSFIMSHNLRLLRSQAGLASEDSVKLIRLKQKCGKICKSVRLTESCTTSWHEIFLWLVKIVGLERISEH